MIFQERKGGKQLPPQRFVGNLFRERRLHAHQPLIAFGLSNGKREVPRAQSGMAVFFDKQRRTTEPTAQKFKQLLFGTGKIRVHRANASGRWIVVHLLVETGDQPAYGGFAAELFVGGGEFRTHAAS